MDKEINKLHTPSAEDLQRFLSGKMSPEEIRMLTDQAENDPFLKEALEGFTLVHLEETAGILEDIQEKIKKKTGSVPGHSFYSGWYLAAATILIGGLTAVLFFSDSEVKHGEMEKIAVSAPVPSTPSVPELKSASDAAIPAENGYSRSETNSSIDYQYSVSATSVPDPELPRLTVADSLDQKEITQKEPLIAFNESVPSKELEHTTVQSAKIASKGANSVQYTEKKTEVLKGKNSTEEFSADQLQEMLTIAGKHYNTETTSHKVYDKKREKSLKECETCPDKSTEDGSDLMTFYPYKKYNDGDFNAASQYFDEYLKTNPNDSRATLFSCLAKLQMGETSSAEMLLNKLDGQKAYPQTAEWLRAYLQLIQNQNEGVKALKTIKKTNLIYSEYSEKLLKRLK